VYLPKPHIHFSEVEPFLSFVSSQRKERIQKLVFEKDKILSLCTELLIRREISMDLSIEPYNIFLTTEKWGKPRLQHNEDYHFSVSNTQNAIVYVASDSPIGIDVERIREFDSCENIARRIMTPKELRSMQESDQPQLYFVETWTRKEAYTKMTGRGLLQPFNEVDVYAESVLRQIWSGIYDDYQISVCTVNALIEPVKVVSVEDLLAYFTHSPNTLSETKYPG
jgi:4'-phosphopantetheinyl transferase